MIQIKKSKYDNYCTCCRKPFDDSMEVSFSHKDYNDSVNITLCGKCRRELMEALSKADSNSALDHIHNVVAEREYQRGYEQGKADAIKWIPIKTRPLTEEEKEEHPEWDCFLDCELPDEGQEILVTYKAGNKKMVSEDTFFNDDCCYLDSGLELGEEALAWAEKPAPWEGEKSDGQK